jgi:hypothetical protein
LNLLLLARDSEFEPLHVLSLFSQFVVAERCGPGSATARRSRVSGDCGNAELAARIHYHGCASNNWSLVDARDEGRGLSSLAADADGIGFSAITGTTDVDIIVAGGAIGTGTETESNIERAGGVVFERADADGGIVRAGGVARHNPKKS